MNAEHFGIAVTLLVLLAVIAITIILTGLGGIEIPSIIPETITPAPAPNTYYEWCYQMNIDCKG